MVFLGNTNARVSLILILFIQLTYVLYFMTQYTLSNREHWGVYLQESFFIFFILFNVNFVFREGDPFWGSVFLLLYMVGNSLSIFFLIFNFIDPYFAQIRKVTVYFDQLLSKKEPIISVGNHESSSDSWEDVMFDEDIQTIEIQEMKIKPKSESQIKSRKEEKSKSKFRKKKRKIPLLMKSMSRANRFFKMDILKDKGRESEKQKKRFEGLNNQLDYNRSSYLRKQENPSQEKIKKESDRKSPRSKQSRRDRKSKVLNTPKQTRHRMSIRSEKKESNRKHESEKKDNSRSRVSQSRKRRKSERNKDQKAKKLPDLHMSPNHKFQNLVDLRDFPKRHKSRRIIISEESKQNNIGRLSLRGRIGYIEKTKKEEESKKNIWRWVMMGTKENL